MAQVPYITRALLKERLILRQIPEPELDTDLDRLIATASEMVQDRCIPFDASAPPDPVQQVTLMIAMNLRIGETMAYADADGHPVQVRAWTPAMDDILGRWLRDPAASTTGAGANAGTLRTARAGTIHSEYRRPWGVGYPEGWDD